MIRKLCVSGVVKKTPSNIRMKGVKMKTIWSSVDYF